MQFVVSHAKSWGNVQAHVVFSTQIRWYYLAERRQLKFRKAKGICVMLIINLNQRPEAMQQLAQWHDDEWGDYNPGLSLDQRIQRMQPHLDDRAVPSTYVAMEDGILGSADIVQHDMTVHQELTPWLASVYVDQPQRRRGIGSELVKYVMQQAANADFSRLYLFTPDQVAFYQRLGWQELVKESYCDHEVTIMSVDLERCK